MDKGVLNVNGVEVRYMTPEDLKIKKGLKYVDNFGLLPMMDKLAFNPATQRMDPLNILLNGHKGNGKSLLFAYMAEKGDIPYLALDCSEGTRERHFRGGFVAKSGDTPFVLGTVANAIQVANEAGIAMLVLEEINALSPQRQKELNAVADFRKKIEIPELGWRLELNKDAKLLLMGTMNPTVYGGVYELNDDLKSRFFQINIPYPPAASEKRIIREACPEAANMSNDVIDKLVAIANQTRQEATGYSLSPRDLVQFVQASSRLGWEDALFLLGQKFEESDRKLVLDRVKDITKIAVFHDLADRATSVTLAPVPFAVQGPPTPPPPRRV